MLRDIKHEIINNHIDMKTILIILHRKGLLTLEDYMLAKKTATEEFEQEYPGFLKKLKGRK